jgi:hypothetical protein
VGESVRFSREAEPVGCVFEERGKVIMEPSLNILWFDRLEERGWPSSPRPRLSVTVFLPAQGGQSFILSKT